MLLLALALAACGGDDGAAATTTPTAPPAGATATIAPATATNAASASTATPTAPVATATQPAATATQAAATPTSADTLLLSVYFMRDEKIGAAHREVPHTLQVATAAMNLLLEGPTQEEIDAGMSTAVPQGTRLLGISIDAGVATVDLSGEFASGGGSLSMAARLAQVVYTLTQFPTVETVTFMLDGEPVDVFGGEGLILDHPVGRANFEELTPAIFVEAPAVGDEVSSPMRIWGTANTFEAMFMVTLRGPGDEIVFEEPAMATSGSGTRGTFDLTFTWDADVTGAGTLVVWEASAKDGSPINVVEIPVTIVAE